jgi:hypothetical protein
LISSAGGQPAVVQDDFVTVMAEIANGPSATDGISVSGLAAATQVVIRNNLIHNVPGDGIEVSEDDSRVDILNNTFGSGVGAFTSRWAGSGGSRFAS